MTKKRSTKRALLTSALSLLLCVSMLIGSTFAWFTDSVTSANNIIKSGNLDVELYYQVEGQSDWTKVTDTTNVFMANALWEPGHTEVVKLKVVNEGSLALKYQLGVNIADEIGSVNVNGTAFKLSDFIKYAVIDGEQDYTREQAVAAAEANGATLLKTPYNSDNTELLAKSAANTESADIVTMVVYMPTTVGNEANYAKGQAVPTIHLGINLIATQYTAESDSFGSDYDKNATYPAFKTQTAKGGDTITAGEVAIKLPAGAEEAEYTVNVDNKVVTTDAAGDTTVSFDIELLKNGVKVVSQNGVTYRVGICIGENLNVTEVTHKGAAVANWKYDSTEGVVSFETDSFSPFAVSYFSGMVKTSADVETLIAKGADLIVLDQDIKNLDEPLEIPAGVEVTLDLNGNTINTAYAEGSTTNHMYAFTNNGTLLLKNGTVNARGIFNYGNMIIENATINAIDGNGGYAIRNYSGSTLTMNNGKLATTLEDDHLSDKGGYDATALRVDAGSSAVINGGTIENICDFTSSIENYGTVEVNNVKITAIHTAVYNTGTMTFNGGSVSCGMNGSTRHTIYDLGGKVTINGGTFINTATDQNATGSSVINGNVEVNGGTFSGRIENYKGTPVIKGGTFDTNPSKYLAKNCKAIDNGDGTWTVADSREVITSANATKPVAPLEEDFLFPKGTNAVIFKDAILSGDAQIVHTEKAVLGLSNISGELDHDVIVRKSDGAIVIYDCEFTLTNDAKLITVGEGGDAYQVFLINVYVNGELLTQENAGQYLKGISWFGAYTE